MADINFSARLEAISELANIADADFTAENGEITNWTKGDKPTEEEIQTKMDSVAYVRNRKAEYPSIAELTVALYDTDDKAAIETKRAAVKAKWPKDNSGPK